MGKHGRPLAHVILPLPDRRSGCRTRQAYVQELRMNFFDDHVARFRESALAEFSALAPWELTSAAAAVVERVLSRVGDGYAVSGNIGVHRTATIEDGATVKGPAVIGPDCFIAAGAYLRGGCWLDARCILGPAAELKSSFLFPGSTLAHLNFVGDSILGAEVNLEAGAIIANRRNEWAGATISFIHRGKRIETGAPKFGALIGDHARIGANAVIAPGAILAPATIVQRLSLLDYGAENAGRDQPGTTMLPSR
jgi:UDP-N-acetylglucosamine diphosphorylase / glucose-1-phosphate thymidylyltransferase / UDP-N-acetylgalactosamine diphosphorylase / glucosamine-1-phosphate N-acetyltransferase / galactosamine-1-phosphate N-acetyltransferase